MFRILVVDESKRSRTALKTVLEAENYTVLTSENGDDALEVLAREHIDLVVLDVALENGYTLTQTLRESDKTLPLLIVSAKGAPEDVRRGFLCGADDYMVKPIDEVELILRIKALMRRAKNASEQILTVGSATLDFLAMTVSRPGETVSLPQKEFLLLFRLLSQPGRIFTRIGLMDEIWGAGSESGWETVTVHIARLRKRFSAWPEFKIEAVRGLGYRAVLL